MCIADSCKNFTAGLGEKMKSLIRKSKVLTKPDVCSNKREIFIESLEPVEFTIQYYDANAIKQFDQSVAEFLPCLPWGYHWEKVGDEYGIYKSTYTHYVEMVLIVYGPDEKSHINYNLLVDGHNSYTLSHTRNSLQTRLTSRDRSYPSPIKSNASGYKFNVTQYMPGHCIDHIDSIIPPANIVKKYGNDCNSSFNFANYIPEIQKDYWGLHMRKGLVLAQRKLGCSYAQLVEYPDEPNFTVSGAAIPESVYFYSLSPVYKPKSVSWIDWEVNYNNHKKPKNLNMVQHMENYSTSLAAAPKALIWDINKSPNEWIKAVKDSLNLGHNIKNNVVESYNSDKDQLYAYGNSSMLELTNSYASISTALAASPQGKIKLTKANLNQAIKHGLKLLDLDKKTMPINEKRYDLVNEYHINEMPGFEDEETIDVIKQLTFK